jgi:hypothetical protein
MDDVVGHCAAARQRGIGEPAATEEIEIFRLMKFGQRALMTMMPGSMFLIA